MTIKETTPTFETVRKASRNGTKRVYTMIYGTSIACRAMVRRTKAQIDFDLHSTNYDLHENAQERLYDEYRAYVLKTGLKSDFHSHFSKSSIWFEVRKVDAQQWFEKVLTELRKSENLVPCEATSLLRDYLKREADEVLVSALVEPVADDPSGNVIRLIQPAWHELVRLIQAQPDLLYSVDSRKLEELIAGAYEKAGFDRVILTPRSGDHGRDVVAERTGWGCIKIIEQVKAFKPGHLVTANDVRALGHVLNADQSASKGIVTTTSDFAPRIVDDPFLKPFLPTRIELVNGSTLLDRLVRLYHGETF